MNECSSWTDGLHFCLNLPTNFTKTSLFLPPSLPLTPSQTQEKIEIIFESCLFKVDEYGFFIYWKPAGRVSSSSLHPQFSLDTSMYQILSEFLSIPSEVRKVMEPSHAVPDLCVAFLQWSFLTIRISRASLQLASPAVGKHSRELCAALIFQVEFSTETSQWNLWMNGASAPCPVGLVTAASRLSILSNPLNVYFLSIFGGSVARSLSRLLKSSSSMGTPHL